MKITNLQRLSRFYPFLDLFSYWTLNTKDNLQTMSMLRSVSCNYEKICSFFTEKEKSQNAYLNNLITLLCSSLWCLFNTVVLTCFSSSRMICKMSRIPPGSPLPTLHTHSSAFPSFLFVFPKWWTRAIL